MKVFYNKSRYSMTGEELMDLQMQAIRDWMDQRKTELRESIYEGDRNCPICINHIKANKIELTKSMINSLYSLFCLNEQSNNVLHHKDDIQKFFKLQSNVIGKLKHWKLVDQHKGGRYSITDEGKAFINGKLSVPQYQWIYKDKRIRPNQEVPETDIFKLINKFKMKNIVL